MSQLNFNKSFLKYYIIVGFNFISPVEQTSELVNIVDFCVNFFYLINIKCMNCSIELWQYLSILVSLISNYDFVIFSIGFLGICFCITTLKDILKSFDWFYIYYSTTTCKDFETVEALIASFKWFYICYSSGWSKKRGILGLPYYEEELYLHYLVSCLFMLYECWILYQLPVPEKNPRKRRRKIYRRYKKLYKRSEKKFFYEEPEYVNEWEPGFKSFFENDTTQTEWDADFDKTRKRFFEDDPIMMSREDYSDVNIYVLLSFIEGALGEY